MISSGLNKCLPYDMKTGTHQEPTRRRVSVPIKTRTRRTRLDNLLQTMQDTNEKRPAPEAPVAAQPFLLQRTPPRQSPKQPSLPLPPLPKTPFSDFKGTVNIQKRDCECLMSPGSHFRFFKDDISFKFKSIFASPATEEKSVEVSSLKSASQCLPYKNVKKQEGETSNSDVAEGRSSRILQVETSSRKRCRDDEDSVRDSKKAKRTHDNTKGRGVTSGSNMLKDGDGQAPSVTFPSSSNSPPSSSNSVRPSSRSDRSSSRSDRPSSRSDRSSSRSDRPSSRSSSRSDRPSSRSDRPSSRSSSRSDRPSSRSDRSSSRSDRPSSRSDRPSSRSDRSSSRSFPSVTIPSTSHPAPQKPTPQPAPQKTSPQPALQKTTPQPAPQKTTPPPGISRPAPQKNTPPPGISRPAPQKTTPLQAPQKNTPPPGISRPAPQKTTPLQAPQKTTPPPGISRPAPQKITPLQAPQKTTPPPGISRPAPQKITPLQAPQKTTPPPGISRPAPQKTTPPSATSRSRTIWLDDSEVPQRKSSKGSRNSKKTKASPSTSVGKGVSDQHTPSGTTPAPSPSTHKRNSPPGTSYTTPSLLQEANEVPKVKTVKGPSNLKVDSSRRDSSDRSDDVTPLPSTSDRHKGVKKPVTPAPSTSGRHKNSMPPPVTPAPSTSSRHKSSMPPPVTRAPSASSRHKNSPQLIPKIRFEDLEERPRVKSMMTSSDTTGDFKKTNKTNVTKEGRVQTPSSSMPILIESHQSTHLPPVTPGTSGSGRFGESVSSRKVSVAVKNKPGKSKLDALIQTMETTKEQSSTTETSTFDAPPLWSLSSPSPVHETTYQPQMVPVVPPELTRGEEASGSGPSPDSGTSTLSVSPQEWEALSSYTDSGLEEGCDSIELMGMLHGMWDENVIVNATTDSDGSTVLQLLPRDSSDATQSVLGGESATVKVSSQLSPDNPTGATQPAFNQLAQCDSSDDVPDTNGDKVTGETYIGQYVCEVCASVFKLPRELFVHYAKENHEPSYF
ncbi:hypothetical protein Pmani_008324 [Petrolisthes manimaculis]|uniref:C2H2-type domain-containing protein n=1 Tax=Petrolisthes manimaculis TaxID=1843537 RepID=A0AAE1UE02_9EUCA|nr:hypothetical protein Pmani_008324 [Petrolisthes manimaculis]